MRLLNKSGFSLVELMITVGILGTLASVAVPSYSLFVDKARYGKARAEIGGYASAFRALRAAEDTTLLVANESFCSSCFYPALGGWAKIGLTALPLDPWGVPYNLEENEGEAAWFACRQDVIFSYGKNKAWESDVLNIIPLGDDVMYKFPYYSSLQSTCAVNGNAWAGGL